MPSWRSRRPDGRAGSRSTTNGPASATMTGRLRIRAIGGGCHASPLERATAPPSAIPAAAVRTLGAMNAPPLTELVPVPAGGRVFAEDLRPGLADCAPTGRIRLDAIARWLQDVAYADVEDAGLAQSAVWVIRRARIHVKRFPRFGERFRLATFCSGLGRMW